MTIEEYKEKLQKLQTEINYLAQQRQVRVEEFIKTQGAIEALESHNCKPETTETLETSNG